MFELYFKVTNYREHFLLFYECTTQVSTHDLEVMEDQGRKSKVTPPDNKRKDGEKGEKGEKGERGKQ